jgi:uncharacterized membrane protein
MTWSATTTARSRLRPTLTTAVTLAVLTIGAVEMSGSGTANTAAESTLLVANAAGTAPVSPAPGFLLTRGRYTTIEAPGATEETGAVGINNGGMIVGGARGGGRPDRGFVRDTRGRYTDIRYPGARSTLAQKINDRGQITGYYSRVTDDPRGRIEAAFLLDHGRFTRIAYPGGTATTAVGINNRTQVVGQYQGADGVYHGYLWDRGRFRTIDAPGAAGTSLLDINDRGQILGARVEPDGTFRGFVLDRGRYTTFTAPGNGLTLPTDINNRGQIVVSTVAPTDADPLAGARAFLLAKGANGPFTPIEVPGAPRTFAFGLNDAGAIVGVYENPASQPARTPPMEMPSGQVMLRRSGG